MLHGDKVSLAIPFEIPTLFHLRLGLFAKAMDGTMLKRYRSRDLQVENIFLLSIGADIIATSSCFCFQDFKVVFPAAYSR